MTRADQKLSERSVVDFYAQVMGIEGLIEEGSEPPGFLIRNADRQIGIEVTEYHQPVHSGNRFKRSQVEQEWFKLRESVVKYREANTGLENLSVILRFSGLRVPGKKQHDEFIRAVDEEIRRVHSGLGDRFTPIWIGSDHPPILRSYLTKINVRRVNCYIEWNSNLMSASIGTSDPELTEMLRGKLAGTRPGDLDDYHLVVAGDGPSGGTMIGILHPEILNTWSGLNTALENGPFDVVAILTHWETHLWRREFGWTMVEHGT